MTTSGWLALVSVAFIFGCVVGAGGMMVVVSHAFQLLEPEEGEECGPSN